MFSRSGTPTPAAEGSLARRVFEGAAWLSVAGGLGRLASLVTAPILTTLVSPAGYGVAGLISAFTSLTSTVALAGVDASYARHWAGGSGPDAEAVERFCWRFAMTSSLLWGFVMTILWIVAPGLRGDAPPGVGILICVIVPTTVLVMMSRFRARFRRLYRPLSLSLMAAAGVTAVTSIAIAVLWRADEWALLLGALMGLIAEVCILGLPRRVFQAGPTISGWRRRWRTLEIGFASLATGSMYWVISSADRWFIVWHRDASTLGAYVFASSVAMVGVILNNAIISAWIPEVTADYADGGAQGRSEFGREWARLCALMLVVWLAVSSSGGDIIRLIANDRFHEGARYVPWMAAGALFYGIAAMGTTSLWLAKDLKPSAYWWAIGAASSVALNALVVPGFGASGAAVVACASFALIASGTLWSAHRVLAFQIPWIRLALVALFVACVGASLAAPWHSQPLLSLAIKGPVGLAAAAVVGLLAAPDWAHRALRRARSLLPFSGGSN